MRKPNVFCTTNLEGLPLKLGNLIIKTDQIKTWLIYFIQIFFFKALIPLFLTFGISPIGFKDRVDSLICTWQRCTCYTFCISGSHLPTLFAANMTAK